MFKTGSDLVYEMQDKAAAAAEEFIRSLLAKEQPSHETEGKVQELVEELNKLEERRVEIQKLANDLGWRIYANYAGLKAGPQEYLAEHNGVLANLASEVYMRGDSMLQGIFEKLKKEVEAKEKQNDNAN